MDIMDSLAREPLTDTLDRAACETDFAIQEARRRQDLQAAASMPKPKTDEAGRATGECLSCEDPVEPERLALGLGLCCECAHAREARQTKHSRTGAY